VVTGKTVVDTLGRVDESTDVGGVDGCVVVVCLADSVVVVLCIVWAGSVVEGSGRDVVVVSGAVCGGSVVSTEDRSGTLVEVVGGGSTVVGGCGQFG